MKLTPVWKESLRLYRRNFPQLCLMLLVEIVLRGIALCPLMFLADKALAPLALLAVPLYMLMALPARQNEALALQDLMRGGSVFSLRLLSTAEYGRKLLRGLRGMACILLWSALTIAGVTILYVAVMGLVDFITLMSIFQRIGGSVADGMLLVIGAVAASTLLILLGCAVHSGSRHAHALGEKQLLRGNRLRLMGLWFQGLALMLPSVACVAAALGSYAIGAVNALMNLQLPSMALSQGQMLTLLAGVALLIPALPLRSLLPAVYLRLAKEKRDAQA